MKKILTLSLGLVMALGFTGCKNKDKVYNYSDIISTSNIKSIEFKVKNEEDIRYDKNEYITLTSDEKDCFVANLKNNNLQYTKKSNAESKYENNKDTFIITYGNGSKTYFDSYHVLKKDEGGKETYNIKMTPYNCVIGQNIFMDESKLDKVMCNIESMKYLEKERDFYDLHFQFNYSYRYYRSINGYESTDYFDVAYENGKMRVVLKSKDTFKDQKVYEIKYEGYKYDKDDATITKVTQETIYMLTAEDATPVETTHIIRTNGVVDIIEINLYTGEKTESQTHLK